MENNEDLAPSTSSFTRKASLFSNFSMENGWLKQKDKIIVPSARELHTKVLQENHDSPCARHIGFDKIVHFLRQTFWWPHLNKDVCKYVQQFFQCQVNKEEKVKDPRLLHPLQTPKFNWQSTSMDFILGLPQNQR